MQRFSRNASLGFAAGSLGALANSLEVWGVGFLGLAAAIGVKIAPAFTFPWLYPRIVWGGIWGFLFLLPFFKQSPFLRGIIYSLGPTLVQLFVVFPFKASQGMMGLKLGILTPLFVFVANAVWGLVASYWMHYVEEQSSLLPWKR
jgi:hypothetical protein